ncbi:sigma-70 family RNA polymerase sigma factor [Microbacterium panaciterrae]
MRDPRTDAELLGAVRRGDHGAYRVLWERHFDAGLRFARRRFPSRAEDLVSESFLAVFQQLTTGGNGPDTAFRAYLRAVIRNTALHWRKDAEHIVDVDDFEPVDARDGLALVERKAESADVLAAFRALPERWQRVLWLAEVAEAGRPDIARELGITPNAVSALQLRARSGLKVGLLARQVPAALREDPSHAARLLPRHLAEPSNPALAAEVAAHVVVCAACDELLAGMRVSMSRMRGAALSATLLGALGTAVPMVSLSSGSAAAAVVTAAGTGMVLRLAAGGVAAATIGALLLQPAHTPPPAPPIAAASAPALATPPPPPPVAPALAPPPSTAVPVSSPDPVPPVEQAPPASIASLRVTIAVSVGPGANAGGELTALGATFTAGGGSRTPAPPVSVPDSPDPAWHGSATAGSSSITISVNGARTVVP